MPPSASFPDSPNGGQCSERKKPPPLQRRTRFPLGSAQTNQQRLSVNLKKAQNAFCWAAQSGASSSLPLVNSTRKQRGRRRCDFFRKNSSVARSLCHPRGASHSELRRIPSKTQLRLCCLLARHTCSLRRLHLKTRYAPTRRNARPHSELLLSEALLERSSSSLSVSAVNSVAPLAARDCQFHADAPSEALFSLSSRNSSDRRRHTRAKRSAVARCLWMLALLKERKETLSAKRPSLRFALLTWRLHEFCQGGVGAGLVFVFFQSHFVVTEADGGGRH